MEKPTTAHINIDLKQTKQTICEKCNCEAFQEAFMLRKVSALLSATGKEGYIPIQVFACVGCGHVNDEFIPKEVKNRLAV